MCLKCHTEIVVKLRDVLYQGPVERDPWGMTDDISSVICPKEDCEKRYVLTSMCTPFPELSTGKFHNHCELCPGFGQCIGDYRQMHCIRCDCHYYAGNMQQFKCDTCYSSEEDNSVERCLFFIEPRPKKEPSIFSYLYQELETFRFDGKNQNSILKDMKDIYSEALHYVFEIPDNSDSDTAIEI